MKTMLITNDAILAGEAESVGVSRIMIDLESHGKKERQASRTTFISSHQKEDVAKIRNVITKSQLVVRINPWHKDSPIEIEGALQNSADIIMLPMIESMQQFNDFAQVVCGRAQLLPLIETGYSMAHVGDIAAHHAVSELYIGLNDLHLSLGLDFLFEPLALGLVHWMAKEIKAYGKSFGFGGIATLSGAGELPARLILAEHARLGSACVILSSRFGKDIEIQKTLGRKDRLAHAMADLQQHYAILQKREPAEQEADRIMAKDKILQLARQASKQ